MTNKDLKVTFPDGNIKNITNFECSCPNIVDIKINNLIIGKKYTVFITNLNNTPIRTFPESYSFIAENINENLSFYYQFIL